MLPFLRFIFIRLVSAVITFLVITFLLYGVVMLTPPETRAELYMPKGGRMTEEQEEHMIQRIIVQYRLRDPYPVQYGNWLAHVVRGDWGYSPVLKGDVFTVLVKRSTVTAELTFYSILFFIPLGLVAGVQAGARKDRPADHRFRATAFWAAAMPPFILALILIAIFYVQLNWFPIGRLTDANDMFTKSDAYQIYTGFITIDGLLNRRPDIALDAARHLILPVVSLGLVHWATLARVARAVTIEELQKEYILAGRARGLPPRRLVWRHSFRNILAPAVTSSALSAASLFTGVFVIETIYNLKGVSYVVVQTMAGTPDAPGALGFAVYSVIVVLGVMLVLDLVSALADPRIRTEASLL